MMLLLMCCMTTMAQTEKQIAFPGAEGFGRYTTGGRGGKVYHVTTLEDERFAILYNGLGEKYNDVKGLINRLITQNQQMVKALYDSRNEFLKAERYNRLKQIEGKIDSALIANTIESIQDQFEQFN